MKIKRAVLRVLLTADPIVAVVVAAGASLTIPSRLFALCVTPPYSPVYVFFPSWMQWMIVVAYVVQVAVVVAGCSLRTQRHATAAVLCLTLASALMQGLGAPRVLSWVLWLGVAWVQLWVYWRLTLRERSS